MDQVENDSLFGINYHSQRNFSKRDAGREANVAAHHAFNSWRDGECKYDIYNPIVTDEHMQFARMASKSTEQYGCAQAHYYGPGGGVYTICIYTPEYIPGNERENLIPILQREFDSECGRS